MTRRKRKGAQVEAKRWTCKPHRTPEGERCALCDDQLGMFDAGTVETKGQQSFRNRNRAAAAS